MKRRGQPSVMLQVNQDEVVGYIAIQGGSATLQSTTGGRANAGGTGRDSWCSFLVKTRGQCGYEDGE